MLNHEENGIFAKINQFESRYYDKNIKNERPIKHQHPRTVLLFNCSSICKLNYTVLVRSEKNSIVEMFNLQKSP